MIHSTKKKIIARHAHFNEMQQTKTPQEIHNSTKYNKKKQHDAKIGEYDDHDLLIIDKSEERMHMLTTPTQQQRENKK